LGLIYMNARFYVPGIGRFASADTIVPDGKDPQAYNRYTYVSNNPVRFTDPTGHCVERQCEAWKGRWGHQTQQESALTVEKSEWVSLPDIPSIENNSANATTASMTSTTPPSMALLGWSIASQSTITLAELTNALDGGQSRWIAYSGNGPATVTRAKAVEGVPRLAKVFAGASYTFIGAEAAYDIYQLKSAYNSGGLNEREYNFHYDAAIGKAGFNTTMTTAAIASSPMGGAMIAGTQIGFSMYYDPAVAAGQLWAVVRIGEVTFADGTATTGRRMLWNHLLID
jgi:hypothetical protein